VSAATGDGDRPSSVIPVAMLGKSAAKLEGQRMDGTLEHRCSRNRRSITSILAMVVLASWTGGAVAADDEADTAQQAACAAAREERSRIDTPALRQVLRQSPDAIAGNLSQSERDTLKRLIVLDEKIMFACRLEPHPALALSLRENQKNDAAPASRPKLAMAPPPTRKPKELRRPAAPARARGARLPLPSRNPLR
jgi:hypothetical protein